MSIVSCSESAKKVFQQQQLSHTSPTNQSMKVGMHQRKPSLHYVPFNNMANFRVRRNIQLDLFVFFSIYQSAGSSVRLCTCSLSQTSGSQAPISFLLLIKIWYCCLFLLCFFFWGGGFVVFFNPALHHLIDTLSAES